MQLPESFIAYTRELMGEKRFEEYLRSFEEQPPVSIRMNSRVCSSSAKEQSIPKESEPVAWCEGGYYLCQRPMFTFDPLLHAGVYYVQEAASMFLDHILRSITSQGSESHPCALTDAQIVLDLCAAPGGKSTLMRNHFPDDTMMISNEPMPGRAQILSENMQKWGAANCIVTNSYAKEFRRAGICFDLILCDVPCSGEGMFRKDPATIGEWSPKNVEKCWQLQREIVEDIWDCLRPGGIMVYSTCTFNTKENEENILWICQELGAELIPIPIKEEWNITGSLLNGHEEIPVYRFIPGITRGEGLFMAVIRKQEEADTHGTSDAHRYDALTKEKLQKIIEKKLKIIPGDFLDMRREGERFPQVELSWHEAISYLRREALLLSADTPKGIVTVTYRGFPLGPMKNIGNRANNLYPKEWRIKSTHLPPQPVNILNDETTNN